MVTGIRIYVEGGGSARTTKSRFREGFHGFLASLRDMAREKGIRWDVIPSGSRRDAFDDFTTALRTHRDSWIILLVDSEEAVSRSPRVHLRQRDGWDLSAATEAQVHLMAQAMEAWLLADPETLAEYYGDEFNSNPLPKRPNLEEEPKHHLHAALKAATRRTQKGEYEKIAHASDLLARISALKAQDRAPHCRRLFEAVRAKIAS